MGSIRVAICQVDMVVGDLEGNARRIVEWSRMAEEAGSDLAVFPELALCGYPPEDLLLKPGFVAANLAFARQIVQSSGACATIFGFVDESLDLHNAAMVAAQGRALGVVHKRFLPNYGVFDEQRYFSPGVGAYCLYRIAGVNVGVVICEDAWVPAGPVLEQAAGGAELVVSINASPYSAGRRSERARMLATRAADASAALVYCNLVGGQDELVFDGGSMIFDSEGNLVAAGALFDEELLVCDVEVRPAFRKRLLDPRGRANGPLLEVREVSAERREPPAGEKVRSLGPPERTARVALQLESLRTGDGSPAEVYRALLLGTSDYVRKNGFREVVVGMSGGIDSSLVATVAADALGPGAVHGVAMPSRFSSPSSVADAEEVAKRLGIDFRVVPIEPAHSALEAMLQFAFSTTPFGLAEENLQSRIRGNILMALSNKLGWLVLTTGNKSETAVGYATLYGDTAGGFAPIKDVPKTLVYKLCSYRNSLAAPGKGPIPESVMSKPPSAELRPNQRDDQSLPPYEVLDPILERYVELDRSVDEITKEGFDLNTVEWVASMVDRAEYKRRQSPPGVRVTRRAFGKDRRLPITNRYKEHGK
jgi:NAD+ synthase (glutamine-hydrolysing)